MLPALTPVTCPVLLTDAIKLFAELHTPPEVASDRLVNEPTQRLEAPLMAATDGGPVTVMAAVATDDPQLLLTE